MTELLVSQTYEQGQKLMNKIKYYEERGHYKDALPCFNDLFKVCKFLGKYHPIYKDVWINHGKVYEQKYKEFQEKIKEQQQQGTTNKQETNKQKDKKTLNNNNNKSTNNNNNKSTNNNKSSHNNNDNNSEDMSSKFSDCFLQGKSKLSWKDIIGLKQAKEALKEAIVLPIMYPQLFEGKRKPWKGILLYGPSGTGKTVLAKSTSNETEGHFISVSASNMVSKYMGESERLVKGLFDLARQKKPAIIFIDEIDSVMSARSEGENDATRRLKTEFLIQMQGVGNQDDGILVLGATSVPWDLDPAVRRRFQKKIYIGLPDEETRAGIFKVHLGDTYNSLKEEDFKKLAKLTEGFSGSDIATLSQEAILEPLRRVQEAKYFVKRNLPDGDFQYEVADANTPGAFQGTMYDIDDPDKLIAPNVLMSDYQKALQHIKPTIDQKALVQYKKFTDEFGQEG